MPQLLREPLLHFLVIGALIFLAYGLLNPPQDEGSSETAIVIDDATTERLAAQYTQVWRRPPTVEELDTLITSYIREEVLVREALALSMDQGDTVIRQRMAQKMAFLLDAAAGSETPPEDTLIDFYARNSSDYVVPGQIAFDQVFLGERPTPQDIAETLSALQAGETPDTPPTLLAPSIPLTTQPAIDGRLGGGFYAALQGLPPEVWTGPVTSGYGQHLVRITERTAPATPPFEAVRNRIEADWRSARAQELSEAAYQSILTRYDISRPGPDALAPLTR